MDNGRAQSLCRRQNSMDPPRSPKCNRVAINNSHAHARELQRSNNSWLCQVDPFWAFHGSHWLWSCEHWNMGKPPAGGNYKPHRSTFLGHQTAWSSGRRFRGIPTLDSSWPQPHFGLHCIFCFTLFLNWKTSSSSPSARYQSPLKRRNSRSTRTNLSMRANLRTGMVGFSWKTS